jgi:hypothetical protein
LLALISSEFRTDWFEAALEPFREDMLKYQQLSMLEQAEAVCLGILKGVYDFQWYSKTEFKDWAVDLVEALTHLQHCLNIRYSSVDLVVAGCLRSGILWRFTTSSATVCLVKRQAKPGHSEGYV